jgi:hypothetical protein
MAEIRSAGRKIRKPFQALHTIHSITLPIYSHLKQQSEHAQRFWLMRPEYT